MKGLCLSGGGIKAAAHIGAIKALEEKNIKFDAVAGTSSGSIIATLYALGYSSDEMIYIFKQYSKNMKQAEIRKIIKLIYGLIFKREIIIDGLNSGKFIEKALEQICKENNIKYINEIKMPLIIPAVDLQTGTLIVASSKQIRKTYSDEIKYVNEIPITIAVRASCSYPAVIAPCIYENRQLVDGGIRENMPWKELREIGADEILGIGFETLLEGECCKNMIESAIRSIELVCHELSNYELEGIDNLVKIPTKKISLLDASKIDELYELGYKTMKRKIST